MEMLCALVRSMSYTGICNCKTQRAATLKLWFPKGTSLLNKNIKRKIKEHLKYSIMEIWLNKLWCLLKTSDKSVCADIERLSVYVIKGK